MAGYNLADYESVEERLRRFHKDHPDGRIITENETIPEYRAEKIWVVKTLVFFSGEDLERGCPKATGLAYEVDSANGPQKSSALEVCETSSIGRALANCGYSGNKRASLEEMQKVERFEANQKTRDYTAEAKGLKDIDQVRLLWGEASKAGAPDKVLNELRTYAEKLAATGKRDGAGPGVSGSAA
jgi:hypothetical protein